MPILELKNLTIGYEKPLLGKINLNARKGELIALIGLNGVGKSTLLKTISGIIKPIDGEIFVYKRNIEKIPAKILARKIGFSAVSDIHVSNLTVRDLVSLGRIPHTSILGSLTEKDQRAIDKAIENCDLTKIENREISRISDGQRQRAFIARLIAQQTDILIFDEPTAFLDIEGKYKITNLFRDIAKNLNKTILFSTHDLKIAIQTADKIWLFSDDKIIDGLPEDLVINNCFSQLFSHSNINFNNFTADFDVVSNVRGSVQVISNNNKLKKNWTINALRKIGYSVDNKSDIIVAIYPEFWQIKTKNSIYKAKSLAEMIKILQSDEKN